MRRIQFYLMPGMFKLCALIVTLSLVQAEEIGASHVKDTSLVVFKGSTIRCINKKNEVIEQLCLEVGSREWVKCPVVVNTQ